MPDDLPIPSEAKARALCDEELANAKKIIGTIAYLIPLELAMAVIERVAISLRTLNDENARQRAVIEGLRDVFKAASDERLSRQKEAHTEALRWVVEGDMYSFNFHEGIAAGMNKADIIFHRVLRAIDAALAAAETKEQK